MSRRAREGKWKSRLDNDCVMRISYVEEVGIMNNDTNDNLEKETSWVAVNI